MITVDNIVEFPDEILLLIFNYLSPSDRRVISECCSRLLGIWLSDEFIEDRRLVFGFCKLNPACEPLMTFTETNRSYCHLSLGDVIMGDSSEIDTHFGKTATIIELTGSEIREFCWSKFPNLKRIEVLNPLQLGDISKLPNNLETIVIDDLQGDDAALQNLCQLSKSVKIEIDSIYLTSKIVKSIEKCGASIQKVGLKNCRRINFATLCLPNLRHLECDMLGKRTDQSFEDLMEKLPLLESLKLTTYDSLPHTNWALLKELHVQNLPQSELPQIKKFENLEVLELEVQAKDWISWEFDSDVDSDIDFKDDSDYDFNDSSSSNDIDENLGRQCFFVHESYLNKNMKKFKLTFEDEKVKNPCTICFTVMTKTFPNLENLSCDFYLTTVHLKELKRNIPKLKSLALQSTSYLWENRFMECVNPLPLNNIKNLTELICETQYMDVIDMWPLMPNLRKLDIVLQYLNDSSVKMFEKVPSIENLFINCTTMDHDNASRLIETMVKPLKRLKELVFECKEYDAGNKSKTVSPEVVDIIGTHCKYLKFAYFPDCFNEDDEKAVLREMMKKHPSMRKINEVYAYQDN